MEGGGGGGDKERKETRSTENSDTRPLISSGFWVGEGWGFCCRSGGAETQRRGRQSAAMAEKGGKEEEKGGKVESPTFPLICFNLLRDDEKRSVGAMDFCPPHLLIFWTPAHPVHGCIDYSLSQGSVNASSDYCCQINPGLKARSASDSQTDGSHPAKVLISVPVSPAHQTGPAPAAPVGGEEWEREWRRRRRSRNKRFPSAPPASLSL